MVNEFLASVSYDQVYLVVPNEEGLANRSRYGIDYPYIFPERKEIFDKIPTIAISSFQDIDGSPYPARSSGPIYQLSNNTSLIRANHSIKFGVRFERAGQNDFDQINVSGVPGGTNNPNCPITRIGTTRTRIQEAARSARSPARRTTTATSSSACAIRSEKGG